MRINGSGVYLHPADQELLGITHTDHYPLWLIGSYLISIANDSLTQAAQAEIARFEELREEWDTVERVFDGTQVEGSTTNRLIQMIQTLEIIAREQ